MKISFKKKSWLVLVINLVISFLIICIFNYLLWYFLTIPIYFFIVSTISHWYLNKVLTHKPNQFISRYMLLTMIRLIIHIVVIIVLFIHFKEKFLIAGLFFINYLVSTTYEVVIWSSSNRKK